jgi:glycosyltransferase involved in cell wall biosynthesis
MKIVWVINHYASSPEYGPGERHFRLSQELQKAGYSVYIIAAAFTHIQTKHPKGTGFFWQQKFEDVNFLWLSTPKYKGHGLGRLINTLYFSISILLFFKKFKLPKPDIIWASTAHPFVGPSSWIIASYYKALFCYEIRDIWPLTIYEIGNGSKMNPILWLMQLSEDYSAKKANVILSPLPNLKEYLNERNIIKEVYHIPNGINTFDILKIKSIAFEEYNIPVDKLFYIGYSGTISVSNSIPNLLKAAANLKADKRFYFVIVGDGVDMERCRNLAKELNLENVSFIGQIPRVKALGLMKNCNALYNGAPNSKLYKYGTGAIKIPEYMALGIPILDATKTVRNPIVEFNCGVNILPENATELSDGILRIFKMDESEKRKIVDNSIAASENIYSFNNIGLKLIDIFNRIIIRP